MSMKEAREELRQWAIKHTDGCGIQEAEDGSDWPCGTCFCYLIGALGANEDGEHNDPPDRTNEVWRAILQIRDAEYQDED